MKNQIFVISDIDGFSEILRDSATKEIDTQELKLVDPIRIGQIANLIDEYCLGYDNNGLPLVDEEIMNEIYKDIKIWINNTILAKLAAANILECAWDTNLNEMIFWYPSQETKDNGQRKNSSRNKRSKG